MTTGSQGVRWVLESGVFGSGATLSGAALAAGHRVTSWSDDLWARGTPSFSGEIVMFHGALGTAARIVEALPWRPGAWCAVEAFHCSAWYGRASRWLLQSDWTLTTVRQLVASPGPLPELFVRPDSPLKPFSGRVLRREDVTLAALDHGFYYDDLDLPVIVAPVKPVGREWRYVVVDGAVVAGSAYAAAGRQALPDDPAGPAWAFAQEIASALEPPERGYVLDVCESEGELRLLELNPFSGADLYACDPAAVVAAVARALD